MSENFSSVKRRLLETRLNQKVEEYEAVNKQIGLTLSSADQVVLKYQLRHIEEEITDLQQQLIETDPNGLGKSEQQEKTESSNSLDMLSGKEKEAGQLLTIIVDANLLDFAPKQEHFVHNLSQLLGILPEQIRILKVISGSVMLTLYMPESAAALLIQKFLAKDPAIQALGISEVSRVELHSFTKQTHEKGILDTTAETVVIRLQLLRKGENEMTVRGTAVPGGGQPRSTVSLPYNLTQLPAILKALDVGAYVAERFKPEYVQVLNKLGLLHEERLHPNLYTSVGQKLFEALFAGEIGIELAQANRSRKPIICQLEFDPEDVLLAQFPWELIHDNTTFCVPRKKGIALTRSIAFAAPPPVLKLKPPLRILLISPRPQGEDELVNQSTAVQTGLVALADQGQVSYETLTPPTWAALEETLYRETFDIIHFDGHGSFARTCPACTTPHYPSQQTCVQCGGDMSQATPQGYLHLEDAEGQLDRLNVAVMQMALADSEAQLVFLSACGSGVTHGVSVFNGIAPALIRIGIPAVVAMQASPPDGSSTIFVQRFYDSLAQGTDIEVAVGNGRRAIFRPQPGEPVSWFMPVVYLRKTVA